MDKTDEQILRAAKEIIVKYIEGGRISPAAFPENFKMIYNGIYETVFNIKDCNENKIKKDESE